MDNVLAQTFDQQAQVPLFSVTNAASFEELPFAPERAYVVLAIEDIQSDLWLLLAYDETDHLTAVSRLVYHAAYEPVNCPWRFKDNLATQFQFYPNYRPLSLTLP